MLDEDCGAEFTARSTLYVHAKRHNVDAASVTFPCEYPDCNKQYSGKSNLRKHMVRCHGQPIKSKSHPQQQPPELVRAAADALEVAEREPQENDYIALLLGDDEDNSSADRSIVTFLAVPTDTLQVYFHSFIPCIIIFYYRNVLNWYADCKLAPSNSTLTYVYNIN